MNQTSYKIKCEGHQRNVLMIILIKKMYELYSVRSHWTYPSNKSSGHIVIYGGDVVVMATVLIVMYTDRFVQV